MPPEDSIRTVDPIQAAKAQREGITLWEVLGGKQPSVLDLETCRLLLEQQFEPIDNITWGEFERMIREDQWSVQRLTTAYRHILKHKSSWIAKEDSKPRIMLSDFYRVPQMRLHPYDPWYLERTANERKMIRGYHVPGIDQPMFGWVGEIGDALPLYEAPEQVKTLPRSTGKRMSDATRQMIAHSTEQLNRLLRVKELELEIDRLNQEITGLRAEIEEQKRQADRLRQLNDAYKVYWTDASESVAALHALVSDLLDGRMTLDDLRKRVADSEGMGERVWGIDPAEPGSERSFEVWEIDDENGSRKRLVLEIPTGRSAPPDTENSERSATS